MCPVLVPWTKYCHADINFLAECLDCYFAQLPGELRAFLIVGHPWSMRGEQVRLCIRGDS